MVWWGWGWNWGDLGAFLVGIEGLGIDGAPTQGQRSSNLRGDNPPESPARGAPVDAAQRAGERHPEFPGGARPR